jgi:probable HAF family extracellular repeat protein
MKSRKLAAILLIALALPLASLAQETRYIVRDLGTFGGTFSWAFRLNNRGQVTGLATLPDGARHAFLWQRGMMTDLGTLGGVESSGGGINARGIISGFAQSSTPDPLEENFCSPVPLICVAVVWREGVATPLPTLGGNNAMAGGISDRGQVVGRAETDHRDPTCEPPQILQYRPVIWTDGKAHDLGTIPGDPDGWALSTNARGQVVGVSTDCRLARFTPCCGRKERWRTSATSAERPTTLRAP